MTEISVVSKCILIPNLATYVRTDVLVASRSLILLTHSLSTQPTYRTNSVTPTCPTYKWCLSLSAAMSQALNYLTESRPWQSYSQSQAEASLTFSRYLYSPAKNRQVQCWPGTLDFHIKKNIKVKPSNQGLSLNGSQYGGCSTKYDTLTSN